MISTGSFLTETGASNKQSELVKKLTAAWEKKNSKSARAGGASLMALSLAACGGEDNTPFSQADVDAAKAEGVASVDITSDNTDVMLAQADYDAAIEAAKTSNDADIAAAAKAEALTSADGTIYADVDAAYTAGSNVTNAAAVEAALTDASGVKHNNVDVAITSNDAAIETAATASAEAALVAGSGFATVADLLAAYTAAVAPDGAVARSLSTSTDVVTDLSGADDTVTGVFGTVASADVIVDTSSSDNDTINLVLATALSPTISNIENVNLDLRGSATATFNATNVTGANNITVESNYTTTSMTIDNLVAGSKVTFADTDFTTVGVNVKGTTDAADSAIHVVLDGAYTATLTTEASNNDVDALTIETKTGASVITMSDEDFVSNTSGTIDTESINVIGDQNLTLIVDQTNANGATAGADYFDGATVTNNLTGDATLTVRVNTGIESGTVDFDAIDADFIQINAAAAANTVFDLASGAYIKNTNAQATADLALSTSDEDSSITVTSTEIFTNGALFTNFDTVNIVGDELDSTVEDLNALTLTNTQVGDTITLNVATGTYGVKTNSILAGTGTVAAVNVTGAGSFEADGAVTANAVNVDTAGAVTFGATITSSDVDISTTKAISVATVTATGGTVDITMADATASTADDAATGAVTATTITIGGAGTIDSGGTYTGSLVVNGAVKFDGTGETLAGSLTSTSSGDVIIGVLEGNVVAGSATGDITVSATTGNSAGFSIVTGSGEDSITLSDIGTGTVSTGAGNDTIDASNEATGNVSLDGGDGVDTITSGTLTGDVLTGGAGTDTFIYSTSAHGSINETIVDFTVGSAGDVLQLTKATINAGAAVTSNTALGAIKAIDTSDTAKTTLTNDDDYIIFTGEGYASNAAFATAVAGTSGVTLANNGDDMLAVWYNTTTAAAVVSVLVEAGGADKDVDSVTDIVSLSDVGLADLASLTVDNFVVA